MNEHINKLYDKILLLTFPFFCYLALIVKWGYEFGRGDQMEILPYSLILNGNQNFQNDFFFQSITQVLPNERWIISKLISSFGSQTELLVFCVHLLSTLLLIHGMEKLGFILIKNKLAARISIFITLVLFNYYYNLGGNELYYNNLQGSNIAKSIGIWSLYFLFKKEFNYTALCILIATLFHPIVGFQLGIIFIGVLFYDYIQKDFKNYLQLVIPLFLIGISFIYIFFIQQSYNEANKGFSDSNFSQIIFHFRNGHHYIPNQFQLNGWILLISCFLSSLLFFWQNKRMKIWLITSLFFILIYCLALFLEFIPIISMQAFKITIWIKYIGVLSFFGFLYNHFTTFFNFKFKNIELPTYLLGILLGIFFLIFAPKAFFPDNVKYDFGHQSTNDDAIKISLLAKKTTSMDALFIVPSNFTEIAYYGQRSCFVSDKANPKYPKAANQWAYRIFLIYGLDYKLKKTNWNLANLNYENNLIKGSLDFKKLGITNIICTTELGKKYKLIGEEGKYKLYQLVVN